MVRLDVGGRPALYLVLSADGAVNRAGSGQPDSGAKDVFMGQAPGPLFGQAMELFDVGWLERSGRYDMPDQIGEQCVLTLTFFLADQPPDSACVLQFRYGAESQGPPVDVQDFVQGAVAVTQDWYTERLAEVGDSANATARKPWWKFW